MKISQSFRILRYKRRVRSLGSIYQTVRSLIPNRVLESYRCDIVVGEACDRLSGIVNGKNNDNYNENNARTRYSVFFFVQNTNLRIKDHI